jgi:uncharacterized protein (TIGR03437 family)
MIPRALCTSLLFAAAAAAQNPALTVVSAASYTGTIAPDSIASIFGSNIAAATASASLDSSGNLPTELGGRRVEVNGTFAPMLYVSPNQINFVVPSGIGAGATTLTLSSSNPTVPFTSSTTVQIAATAPALFTTDASGPGPGAILNAVTYAGAPFLTATLENGSDTRTRLAVYGTGFRHADKVTARAGDSKGGRYDLIVEYAGPAPVYFGLDQLNFIVPAELDGAGEVSLIISTGDVTSNQATFRMDLLPPVSLRLTGLSLNPPFVSGGDPMTAIVSLNGIARSGGFPVTLRSTNLAAQPEPTVTIPEGRASVQSTVTTSNTVSTTQTGSIRAAAGPVALTADFEIDPASLAQLSSVSISPFSLLGGKDATGTIRLTGPAPVNGSSVQLASDNDAARLPAAVNVPFNQASATFTLATLPVTKSVDATVTATLGHITSSAKVTLLPAITLAVDSSSVTGGAAVTATVTLGEFAPITGAQVNLSSSDTLAARVPLNITIPSAQNIGTFAITTSTVTTARTVTISATYGGLTQSVSISVNPPTAPVLSSFTISPTTTTGGTSVQGLLTLTAPAGFGGHQVNFRSSSLLAAAPPAFVTIPQGANTAQFTITTNRVASPIDVTITATAGSITKTAVLTVQ